LTFTVPPALGSGSSITLTTAATLSSTAFHAVVEVGHTPDILLDDNDTFRLDNYGVPGRIECAPGHTKGSISVTLPQPLHRRRR